MHHCYQFAGNVNMMMLKSHFKLWWWRLQKKLRPTVLFVSYLGFLPPSLSSFLLPFSSTSCTRHSRRCHFDSDGHFGKLWISLSWLLLHHTFCLLSVLRDTLMSSPTLQSWTSPPLSPPTCLSVSLSPWAVAKRQSPCIIHLPAACKYVDN